MYMYIHTLPLDSRITVTRRNESGKLAPTSS